MVDIHTHILPFIDDGSESLEASLKMLVEEINQGVNHILITPHALRLDMKPYTLNDLVSSFESFKINVEKNYNVKLYLGQEVYTSSDVITQLRKKNVITLNNSKCILLELPYLEEPSDFDEIIYACDILGLKIILAHIERYDYLSIKKLERLKALGMLFQINSGSIFSKHKDIKNRALKLLKANLVDFIASDIHSNRSNTMQEAFTFVKEKISEELALDVFKNNAKKFLDIG